jgi:hypothetical protein
MMPKLLRISEVTNIIRKSLRLCKWLFSIMKELQGWSGMEEQIFVFPNIFEIALRMFGLNLL